MERYRSDLKRNARILRTYMTDAELCLWQKLKSRQVCGVHFYRQKPLLSYVVDFYCPKAKLVIELDGSQHLEPVHQERDACRDSALAAEGLLVLRFDDRQILLHIELVLSKIHDVVAERVGRQ